MKYAWYSYQNVYTPSECEQILNSCIDNKSDYYVDRGADQKKVLTLLTETTKVEHLLTRFFNNAEQCNHENFGYKLHGKPLTVNLNIYENDKNEYPYHRDHLALGSASDIKLTAILNLSPDQYRGGELEIFDGMDLVVPEIVAQGSMLIFPSFLFHRVKPVIGKRITLSTWFIGPNWR
jgi:PKHD-type hydroxylase